MGGSETVQAFLKYGLGAVDQHFHERPPIVLPAVQLSPSAHALGIARKARSEIDNELFERTVLLVVAEVGNSQRDGARARFAKWRAQAPGMRPSVGLEECRPFGTREMANIENDRDILRRYRHQIGRIGDLGYERAVLAQRRCELQPCTGWPVVENSSQDGLVVGNVAVAALVLACMVGHGLTVAIVALRRATATGDTESVVSPVASSAFVSR